MIIDSQSSFSSSQAVTAAAGSTNYIDLGVARDIGVGKPLYVCVTVNTAVTAAGAATVDFQLQKDSSSAFGTATTIASSGPIAKASLVAGYQFYLTIPVGVDKRYLQMYYSVGTGPLTAGAFTAAIVHGIQKNIAYPDAI